MSDIEIALSTKQTNKAISYSCRLLGMREYSEYSLRQKLLARGYLTNEIEATIAFLLENNWLSDQRFCEVYIRSKSNRGQGLQRINYELKSKGISSSMIEAVLVENPIDWQQICNDTCIKKIESSNLTPELKCRQKLERFLRYRGFSGEDIRASIETYLK